MSQASHEFKGSVDFNQYELRNATFQRLLSPPISPVEGQIYYSSLHKIPFYRDDSKWNPFGVKPVHKSYTNQAALLADQALQIIGYIYYDAELDIYYEKLSTSSSSIIDYNPLGGSGAFVPYTGAKKNVNLGEYGLATGFITFDTTPTNTPTTQGTMFWDVDDLTVDIILNGFRMKIGEDIFYPVKNQTASLIPKGTNVRFAGTFGSSSRLLITPFLANGTFPSSYYMGVTAEDIASGEDGKVLWFGRIRRLNTNSFNENDILYASTTVAGGFQTTMPQAPNNIIEVAAVVKKSINQGTIFVRPQFGSNINRDEGVKIITPLAGNILEYQASGLWENVTKAQFLGGTSTQFVKGDGTLDSSAYITTISGIAAGGELTGTYPNPSLLNSAVIDKVLTGLNVTGGGVIVSTDSILQAFGKIQNQISSVAGGLTYQGTWDANSNTPTIVSSVGVNGHFYVVNVAGTTNVDGTSTWNVGDWIIFNGTIWNKLANTDAVTSVNSYIGAVSLVTGDIMEGAGLIAGRPSQLYFTDSRARAAISLTTSGYSGVATYNSTTGVLNIPNYAAPTATSSILGLVKLFSDTVQTVASNSISTTASRTYAIQFNASSQMVVNVPWTDTVYVHPNYTTRSIDTSGAQVIDIFTSDSLGSVTNITTRTMTLADLGYTGATNADNYSSWLLAASGTAGTASITSGATVTLSAGTGMTVTRSTNTINFATTITQYTDALARAAISLTTTGNSGVATYNNTTGVLNVPNYTLAGLGGFSNPMTTLGDLIYGAASGVATRLAGNTTTAKQFLSQTGTGTVSAIPVWATIVGSDITGAALTRNNDTNVTITLGGTPATSLLRAVSMTLGWTGTLSIARGGTGLSALGTSGQLLRVNSGATALEYFTPTYISGNQTITISGDASGSGATSISLTLATVNANIGTFNNLTVNAKGLVTSASNVAYLTANQSITWTASGDITGSASGATSITPSLTVTGLRGVSLPTLTVGGGLLKYTGTGTNTWIFDTATYLTSAITSLNGLTSASQTFTNDTNVIITSSGSAHAIGWSGQLPVSRGGTGASTLTGVLVGNGTSAVTGIVGSALQLLRRNSANTAYEFFTHDFVNQAGARSAVSLTTTGDSGPATYTSSTGVFNIPNYTLSGLGGVPTTTTINGLALSSNQTFSVGSSGTDFNIVSSGTNHTFNLPNASLTNRGLVTTGTQTFAGEKTFYSQRTILDTDQIVSILDGRVNGESRGVIYFGTWIQFNAFSGATGGFLWKNGALDNVFSIQQNGVATFLNLAGTGTRIVVANNLGTLSTQAIPTLSGLGGVPTTTTLTINGTTFNLSANRSWSVGTVTSVATGTGLTGGTITTTGTLSLTGQALALHNLATNGIIARTGSGTVVARTIAAGAGISITNGDGVSGNPTIASTITQYTDALARGAISLTTTGNSGASTYTSSTGVFNIPNYTLSGLGGSLQAVTSIGNTTTLPINFNNTSSGSTNRRITFTSPDLINEIGRISFNITTAERAYIGAERNVAGGQLTDLYFGTMGVNRLLIRNNGNVLINTSTDNGARFQVNGGATFVGNVVLESSANRLIGLGASSSDTYLLFNSDDSAVLNVASGKNFNIQRATGSFIDFDGAGIRTHVGGIRTTAPVGTTADHWKLGRAVVATSVINADRWIRVQIGSDYYDILAIYVGSEEPS
jgi:hypothetical protein